MATIREPMSPAGALRAKHAAFAGNFLVPAHVLYRNERLPLDFANPEWAHIEPFKWWLLPHGLAGACALLLADIALQRQELQQSGHLPVPARSIA